MLPNFDKRDDRDPATGPGGRSRLNVVGGPQRAADVSVFKSPNASALHFPATTRLDRGDVEGTVGAAALPDANQSYGSGSRAFLSNAPLGRAPMPATAPGLRANLIGELREISGQVNRMMAQVDRAIHRLGEHAGEPLRR
jgi:hypothetical protein